MIRRSLGGTAGSKRTVIDADPRGERAPQAATEMVPALPDLNPDDEPGEDATRIRPDPRIKTAETSTHARVGDLQASQCLRAALEALVEAQSNLAAVPATEKQRVAAGAYLIDRAIAEVREKLAALQSRNG